MIDAMSAQVHCINLSKNDIADAYEMLVNNTNEFLSDTPGGQYLRHEAMKYFKMDHPDCTTIEQLAMQADLDNNIDIKNACMLKIDAERYAEKLLIHKK